MTGAPPWRIDVWQFVRVMVAVESLPGAAAARAWGEIWREVDDRLDRLQTSDPDGFAHLMMCEEVVLPVPDRTVLDDAARALEQVDRELAAALAERGLPARRRADLAFEREALRKRRAELSRRGTRARRRAGTAG